MDESGPTTSRSAAARPAARSKKKASASTTPWPTWWSPRIAQDYLHDQLSWFELDEPIRQMGDRIIYNLDANGYLQGRLEDLIDPNGPSEPARIGAACFGRRAEARSAGRRRPRPERMPAAATDAGHAILRRTEDADLQSSGRSGAQSPAADRRKTGFSIEMIQEALERAAQAEAQAGRRIHVDLRAPASRPTCSSN